MMTVPERPDCDYTHAPALSPAQLCRCGTCQLYAAILFQWLELATLSELVEREIAQKRTPTTFGSLAGGYYNPAPGEDQDGK